MQRPNIVLIMADQLSAVVLPSYGGKGPKTPNIDRLARNGTTFQNTYCNYPLCAPSRFSMMTGRLPSAIGAYDNAAELPAAIPTFVHYLRNFGYQSCLVGKMHFVGPDQLHGFEERLTTEIYPADFGWTPDPKLYDGRMGTAGNVQGISGIGSIMDSGPVAWSMQLEYDEEVRSSAIRKIYDLGRRRDDRPFLLVISFTHPHDPFVAPKKYWDRYSDQDIYMPTVRSADVHNVDLHSQELISLYQMNVASESEAVVKASRHGYYAMTSYIDDCIGEIMSALSDTGQAEGTVVGFTADHGEMLGERGMWYKKSFFEPALRVPLIFSGPDIKTGKRVEAPVSLVDIAPTIIDLAGIGKDALVNDTDGESLVDFLTGDATKTKRPAFAELFDSSRAPQVMIRNDRFKMIVSEEYPLRLYDLQNDKNELENVADRADLEQLRMELAQQVSKTWNISMLRLDIQKAWRERTLVDSALSKGQRTSWEFDPPSNAASRFARAGDVFPDVERRGYVPYATSIKPKE